MVASGSQFAFIYFPTLVQVGSLQFIFKCSDSFGFLFLPLSPSFPFLLPNAFSPSLTLSLSHLQGLATKSQAGFELAVQLCLPAACWDFRQMPQHPAFASPFSQIGPTHLVSFVSDRNLYINHCIVSLVSDGNLYINDCIGTSNSSAYGLRNLSKDWLKHD